MEEDVLRLWVRHVVLQPRSSGSLLPQQKGGLTHLSRLMKVLTNTRRGVALQRTSWMTPGTSYFMKAPRYLLHTVFALLYMSTGGSVISNTPAHEGRRHVDIFPVVQHQQREHATKGPATNAHPFISSGVAAVVTCTMYAQNRGPSRVAQNNFWRGRSCVVWMSVVWMSAYRR